MDHFRHKKSLGQNFLVDRNISAKIVRLFDPRPDQHVLEIGPGEGALTGLLVESGCHLTLVELDTELAERLRERFGTAIDVLEADVLTLDLRAIQKPAASKLRVIGNIPYYITSPILFHLFGQREVVSDSILMMQKEVAERLVSKPRTKEYGILSVMAQTYCEPRLLFNVGAKSFIPPPAITSSVVHLIFRDRPGIAGLEETHRLIVRAAFNQRRKTLRNSLGGLLPEQAERERIFEESGINGIQRAEELTADDFIRLAGVFAASVASS